MKGKTMRQRILVVDDDQNIRSILRELLEDERYEVDTATDGLMALEKLDRQWGRYEAVLLDVSMPQMDGLQLIQLLRQQTEAWLQSIVVLSADHDALSQAVRMGICHVLVKPFDLEAVLAQVSDCHSLNVCGDVSKDHARRITVECESVGMDLEPSFSGARRPSLQLWDRVDLVGCS